ncbi:hypothetical protein GCM10023353_21380 [Tomitella cavernea]|uniref:Uncharacterized protein n=1 Tax=Tomitella cavernea TaxID=1387982 RepID=A0ABP9CP28_9ACTN
MQRVHLEARIHGAFRRNEGLPGHLAAESALEEGVDDGPTVDVPFQAFEIEDRADIRHSPSVVQARRDPPAGAG